MEQISTLLRDLADLRTAAKDVVQLRRTDKSVNVAATLPYADACRHLTCVKAGNRDLLQRIEILRQDVAQSSGTADAHSLSLQNLLYEKDHLQREITKCRDYPTLELDRIQLISIEQLNHEAPDVVSGAHDAHAVQLARLEHERASRMRMEADLDTAKQRLAALRGTSRAKLALIDSLPSLADRIRSTAAPLSEALGLAPGARASRYERALGLPPPLYTLYSQLEAVRCIEAASPSYGAVVLPDAPTSTLLPSSGVGHTGQAAAVGLGSKATPGAAAAAAGSTSSVYRTAASTLGLTVVAASSPDMSTVTSIPPAVRNALYSVPDRRLRVYGGILGAVEVSGTGSAEQDAGKGAEPPAKRARHGQDGMEESRRVHVSLTDLLKPHPKAVVLCVNLGAGKSGINLTCLRFQYLPLLDVVTVISDSASPLALSAMLSEAGAAGGSHATASALPWNALMDLFPSTHVDTGVTAQAWVEARVGSTLSGDEGRTARFPLEAAGHRPFDWAQAMAGLAPLRALDPSASDSVTALSEGARETAEVRQHSAAAVVGAIRTRALCALGTQHMVTALVAPRPVAGAAHSELSSSVSAALFALTADMRSSEGSASLANLHASLLNLSSLTRAQMSRTCGPSMASLQPALPRLTAIVAFLASHSYHSPTTTVRAGAQAGVGTEATLLSAEELRGAPTLDSFFPESHTALVRYVRFTCAAKINGGTGGYLAFQLLLQLPASYPSDGCRVSLLPIEYSAKSMPAPPKPCVPLSTALVAAEAAMTAAAKGRNAGHAAASSACGALLSVCHALSTLLSTLSLALSPAPSAAPRAAAYTVYALQQILGSLLMHDGSDNAAASLVAALRGGSQENPAEAPVLLQPIHHPRWNAGARLQAVAVDGEGTPGALALVWQ